MWAELTEQRITVSYVYAITSPVCQYCQLLQPPVDDVTSRIVDFLH